MKRLFSLVLAVIGVSAAAAPQQPAPDSSGHEFIMSCTYGVLAGTLVGAASLAFTSDPGQSLQTVARGASLGLYAGILLGLYVVYIVPSMEASEEESVALLDRIPMLNPTLHDGRHIDGLRADWTVLRF
jgi:NhaP-type Na+/H+ or K+/H+ antiporter